MRLSLNGLLQTTTQRRPNRFRELHHVAVGFVRVLAPDRKEARAVLQLVARDRQHVLLDVVGDDEDVAALEIEVPLVRQVAILERQQEEPEVDG